MTSDLQVLVGGGDAAEIHFDLLIAAHPHDLLLLQHAQQVGLGPQADVADLVQKYRAAIGHFELALFAILRAGERAFLVAEQLAFEQRFGQCAAVDRHHRHVTPRAGGMDGPRHHFLPGAAFPGDQYGGLGGRHHFDQLHHLLHAGLLPISSVLGEASCRFSRSRTTSRRARLCSSALLTRCESSSGSTGLVM